MNKATILNEIKQRILTELVSRHTRNTEMFGEFLDKLERMKTLPQFAKDCSKIANEVIDKHNPDAPDDFVNDIGEDLTNMIKDELIDKYINA